MKAGRIHLFGLPSDRNRRNAVSDSGEKRVVRSEAGRRPFVGGFAAQKPAGFRSAFFMVDVTAAQLDTLARLLDSRKLTAEVGTVVPLEEARRTREMLAGAPHKRGKIVITMHNDVR